MMIAFFIMALGMFLFGPSSKAVSFPLFLVALFVGGIGNTLLQGAVNLDGIMDLSHMTLAPQRRDHCLRLATVHQSLATSILSYSQSTINTIVLFNRFA